MRSLEGFVDSLNKEAIRMRAALKKIAADRCTTLGQPLKTCREWGMKSSEWCPACTAAAGLGLPKDHTSWSKFGKVARGRKAS